MSSNNIYTSPLCSCIICKKEYSQKGIHSHFRISHSGFDPEFMKNIGKLGAEATKIKFKNRKPKEKIPENICQECGKYTTGKFCNRSCAAKFNNKIRTPESRQKQSVTLKATLKEFPQTHNVIRKYKKSRAKRCLISFCGVCGILIKNKHKKTCSTKCGSLWMSLKLKDFKRTGKCRSKRQYYKSKFAGLVYLESSWELLVAQELDNNNIKWIRPKYLKYTLNDSRKMYYPDFYLLDYDAYLDPKNPYLQIKDIDKINSVIAEHNVKIFMLSKEQLKWNDILKLVSDKAIVP